jgi:hypothetical protein
MWFRNSLSLTSQAFWGAVATSVLAAIEDGMDQAKFRVPRMRGRVPKALDKLHRPALHVLGVWIQGCLLDFAVTDEDLKKDTSE